MCRWGGAGTLTPVVPDTSTAPAGAVEAFTVWPMVRALVVLALVGMLVACTDETPPAGVSEAPSATANCGPVETIPIQGEGHLVGDQEPPVPYNSTPPTSGWHTSVDVAIAVAPDGEPLTEPEQVTVLELGGVLASYNGLEPADQEELEGLAAEVHAGQLAVTPYSKLDPGQVALTAWGFLQQCDALDPAAIAAFVEAYARV